jgi:hypothetical protein
MHEYPRSRLRAVGREAPMARRLHALIDAYAIAADALSS